jgi:hypothetical protein
MAPLAAGLCPPVVGCAPLESLGGSLAGDAANSVFSALSSWLASGASELVTHVLTLISGPTGSATTATVAAVAAPSAGAASGTATVTDPVLSLSWFTQSEGFMLQLMGLVVLPILLISTIGAIARQDLARLARTWLVALPLALVCGLVGVELTQGGLDLTDTLSAAVLSGIDLNQTIGAAVGEIVSSTGGDGPVTIVVIACLAILAGILLWLELVLRSAAIYIALLFLPLAMSGLVWPTTTRMAKRLVEMLVALIMSKFVVAAVLGLGAHAVGQGGDDGALMGAAILLLAGFAPFGLFRMVPIIEAGAIAHLEGMSHRPFQAATRMAQTATGFAEGPIGAAIGLGRHSSDPGVGSEQVGPQAIGEHRGEYLPPSSPGPDGDGAGGGSGGGPGPGGGGAGSRGSLVPGGGGSLVPGGGGSLVPGGGGSLVPGGWSNARGGPGGPGGGGSAGGGDTGASWGGGDLTLPRGGPARAVEPAPPVETAGAGEAPHVMVRVPGAEEAS